MCVVTRGFPDYIQETELVQVKDRELAQAQRARKNEVGNLMKQLQSCVNDNPLLRQQIQAMNKELTELRQQVIQKHT